MGQQAGGGGRGGNNLANICSTRTPIYNIMEKPLSPQSYIEHLFSSAQAKTTLYRSGRQRRFNSLWRPRLRWERSGWGEDKRTGAAA